MDLYLRSPIARRPRNIEQSPTVYYGRSQRQDSTVFDLTPVTRLRPPRARTVTLDSLRRGIIAARREADPRSPAHGIRHLANLR